MFSSKMDCPSQIIKKQWRELQGFQIPSIVASIQSASMGLIVIGCLPGKCIEVYNGVVRNSIYKVHVGPEFVNPLFKKMRFHTIHQPSDEIGCSSIQIVRSCVHISKSEILLKIHPRIFCLGPFSSYEEKILYWINKSEPWRCAKKLLNGLSFISWHLRSSILYCCWLDFVCFSVMDIII